MTDYNALLAEALDRLRTNIADDVADVIAQLEDEGLAHPPLIEPLTADLTARWVVAQIGYVCPLPECGRTGTAPPSDAAPTCAGHAEGRGAHPVVSMVRLPAERVTVPDLHRPLR